MNICLDCQVLLSLEIKLSDYFVVSTIDIESFDVLGTIVFLLDKGYDSAAAYHIRHPGNEIARRLGFVVTYFPHDTLICSVYDERGGGLIELIALKKQDLIVIVRDKHGHTSKHDSRDC